MHPKNRLFKIVLLFIAVVFPVLISAAGDQYEPDDSRAEASALWVIDPSLIGDLPDAIKQHIPQRRTIHHADDEDWVVIAVDPGEGNGDWVELQAAPDGQILDLEIQLYDADGALLKSADWEVKGEAGEVLDYFTPAGDGNKAVIYYAKIKAHEVSHEAGELPYKLFAHYPYLAFPSMIYGSVTAGGTPQISARVKSAKGKEAISINDGAYVLSHPAGTFAFTASDANGQHSVSHNVTLQELVKVKQDFYLPAPPPPPEVISPPSFNPSSGAYEVAQSVRISSSSSGATIYYTIDGAFPACQSGTPLANGDSVLIEVSATLRAIACKTGASPSSLTTADYIIDLPAELTAPVFTPPGGAYTSAQTVQINSDSPATSIHYTLDGSEPACLSGLSIGNGASVSIGESSTLQAVACGEEDDPPSAKTSASYVFLTSGEEGSDAQTPAQLINISTRSLVGGGDGVMIGGFIIEGESAKQVLLRGVGASLGAAGLSGVLADPSMELYDSTSTLIAQNDDWRQNATQKTQIEAMNLAPADAKEPALLLNLEPGAYTALIEGVGGQSGVGMIEVYAVDTSDQTAMLINISTRSDIGLGDAAMVGGFVILGSGTKTVLIRGLGPSLADAGIQGALSDPQLTLFNAEGEQLAVNDNWESGTDAQAIRNLPWTPSHPLDSALLMNLAAGAYTAEVSGINGVTGIGMIEVYVVE